MTPDLVLCAMDDAVRVHRGSLLGLEVDAAVSPANSQGFIAMPGLGTGVGGVPPEVCARQVARAWNEVFGT